MCIGNAPPPKKNNRARKDGPDECVEEGLSYVFIFYNGVKGFESNEQLFLCRGHPVE